MGHLEDINHARCSICKGLHQRTEHLTLQMKAMKGLARQRNWTVSMAISETASGRATRPERETIMKAARQRKIEAVLVWKVDRWGRSLSDLVSTLEELSLLGVALVSTTEFFDMSTPAGKAMVGMLSIFSNFERDMLGERIKAGIRDSKKKHGRPRTALKHTTKIQKLYRDGMNKSAIARKLGIGRTSVIRILADAEKSAK